MHVNLDLVSSSILSIVDEQSSDLCHVNESRATLWVPLSLIIRFMDKHKIKGSDQAAESLKSFLIKT